MAKSNPSPPAAIPPGYTKIPGGVTGKGWLPGQSGNPAGTPKRVSIVRELQKLMSEEEPFRDPKTGEVRMMSVAERIARRLVSIGLHRDDTHQARGVAKAAIGEVLDRIDGQAPQTVNVTTENKAPEDMDDSELQDFLGRHVAESNVSSSRTPEGKQSPAGDRSRPKRKGSAKH